MYAFKKENVGEIDHSSAENRPFKVSEEAEWTLPVFAIQHSFPFQRQSPISPGKNGLSPSRPMDVQVQWTLPTHADQAGDSGQNQSIAFL